MSKPKSNLKKLQEIKSLLHDVIKNKKAARENHSAIRDMARVITLTDELMEDKEFYGKYKKLIDTIEENIQYGQGMNEAIQGYLDRGSPFPFAEVEDMVEETNNYLSTAQTAVNTVISKVKEAARAK